jgi:signal peptidase II
MKKWIIFVGVLGAVLALDLLTKSWAAAVLPGAPIEFSKGVGLRFSENPGIAFGVELGQVIQIVLSVLILAGLTTYTALKLDFNKVSVKIFLALIIGGALGNLYDRIFLGVVRDFIGIGPWPNFNLADAAIVVGVLLFALYSYQPSHE